MRRIKLKGKIKTITAGKGDPLMWIYFQPDSEVIKEIFELRNQEVSIVITKKKNR